MRLPLFLCVLIACAHNPRITAELSAPTPHCYLTSEVNGESTYETALCIDAANQAGASKIILELDTPGGEVFSGMALGKAIENSKAPVTCVVDGMAASMGFYLLQSCDVRVMTRRSLLMAHGPSGGGRGNGGDMAELSELLLKLEHAMVEHMARRMNLSAKEFTERIHKADWWFTNEDALFWGAIDYQVYTPDEVR